MNRKPIVAAGACVATAGIAFATHWFGPHLLFIDERVDEAAPSAAAPMSSGAFQSLEHETKGTALLIELADGRRVLRLENLHTSNGPTLRVLLSAAAQQNDWSVYGKGDFIDLGPLEGNVGSSNYELPRGVDVSKYATAVVWCRRFGVGFGVAPLVRVAAP